MNFQEGITLFYRRCIAKNLSNNTLSAYRYDLLPLNDFMNTHNIKDLDKLTEKDLTLYLADIQRQVSPITLSDRFIALRAFFRYLYKEQYITRYPLENLSRPKIPKKHARTFTATEVNKVLQEYDKDTFIGLRNYTIMCTLLGTGMRKSELLNLSIFDIHFDVSIITVLGKGNKERNIPISPLLKRFLKKYTEARKEYCDTKDTKTTALLVTKGGNKLSVSGLNEVFRKLKQSLDIPTKRLSPHTFRHTFAKSFLLNGGDVFTLQRLLGHEDIATTRIYIDYTQSELKVQNDKYNPLDNTRWQYY